MNWPMQLPIDEIGRMPQMLGGSARASNRASIKCHCKVRPCLTNRTQSAETYVESRHRALYAS
jgi:hypothetical protein